MMNKGKKFIVFSFDDGFADFKENALPCLQKFGLVSTVNIVSGYSDRTIKTQYHYLSIDDVRYLSNQGFEIANHTNSHFRGGSFFELNECNNKICTWISFNKTLGIAMPKYVEPNLEAKKYISDKKPPYITYSFKEKRTKNIFKRLWWKLVLNINNSIKSNLIYKVNTVMYKKGTQLFNRIEVGKSIDPLVLYEALQHIKYNQCITLCFHSITDDFIDCEYPKGAYGIKQFAELCSLISSNKDFKVVSQLDASTMISNNEE